MSLDTYYLLSSKTAKVIVVDRPGYFGNRRPEYIAKYNEMYGEGLWQECWQHGHAIMPFLYAVDWYDNSYYEYLKSEP